MLLELRFIMLNCFNTQFGSTPESLRRRIHNITTVLGAFIFRPQSPHALCGSYRLESKVDPGASVRDVCSQSAFNRVRTVRESDTQCSVE